MAFNPERIKEIRRWGYPVLLYLGISNEVYESAWDEDIPDVWAVEANTSAAILGILMSAAAGEKEAVVLHDEAARGLSLFIRAGVDRQAFLAPAVEALTNTHGDEDPMTGYLDRITAINEAKERID